MPVKLIATNWRRLSHRAVRLANHAFDAKWKGNLMRTGSTCVVVAIASLSVTAWAEAQTAALGVTQPIATIGLEVMRYALPVVAFDAGGIKDWLLDGQNGYLVPWMDRDAFAARIEELLNNKPLAKQMGEAGLKLVSERYDFDSYIGDLEKMFATVIAEKN